MDKAAENTQVKGSVVLKSGIWYTLCTVIQKGIAFLTLPVFTRIMTQSDLGFFNTYATWITLFVTITTFDLPLSIIRSKHEVGKDGDSYAFSILTLTSVTTGVFALVCLLMRNWLFDDVMQMPQSFMLPMFLYLFLSPAIDVFATKQRAFYKYKAYVVTTIISAVTSTLVALLMVLVCENKLEGRFVGQYLTIAAVGLVFYVLIAVQGRRVKLKYWKDGFVLCFPLLLHLLSLYLLSSSDKIMITRFVGEEYTALYSVAYSAVHIATLLMSAMNRSFAPWMLDMLQFKEFGKIRKASVPYALGYFVLMAGCMILAPEIIMILGGEAYSEAVYLMPSLLAGTMFTFVYQMYLQTEFFEKKTRYVGFATIGAAAINVALNLLLIPRFGYLVAGYTTLIGYMFMFAFHYLYVSHLGYKNIFDRRFIAAILLGALLMMGIALLLYQATIVRYVVIGIAIVAVAVLAWWKKDVILARLGKVRKAR